MAIMYLYDTTTYACRGIYEGVTAPAGTADAGVAFTDGRMEWAGGTGPWTLPDAVKEADEREWRDGELRTCDWTQLPDAPFTGPEKTNWSTYRQELRDMPAQAGFPNTHTRPTKPAS
jgi:hypothetical protein